MSKSQYTKMLRILLGLTMVASLSACPVGDSDNDDFEGIENFGREGDDD